MRKALLLRGAIVMLGRAVVHVGQNELTWDYDGSYRNNAVNVADRILRKALWQAESDLEKINGD